MGRDTIQLENAVSTISQEYLLEFTSEYGIPEGLHPELPGPEDTIVDFPEGKVGMYTKFFEFANFRIPISQFLFDILGYYQIHISQLSVLGAAKVSHFEIACRVLNIAPTLALFRVFYVPSFNSEMDLFNLISVPNPSKVKTRIRPRAAHEVPLLIVITNRVIEMKDPSMASGSLGTPSTVERNCHGKAIVSKGKATSRKSGNEEVEGDALPRCRRDHASGPTQSTTGGKSLASMGLEAGIPIPTPTPQKIPADVSDPYPLSYSKPQSIPEQDITQSSKGASIAGDPESEKSSSFTSIIGSPGELCHLPNADFLSQYNINLARKVVMGSQLRLRFEQEVRLRKRSMEKIAKREQRIQAREEEIKRLDAEVKSLKVVETEVHGLRNQAQNLKTLLEAEVDMKKATEARNADLAKELEGLRAKFADLQVIGHGLCLAVMKCAESTDLRQAFADVVSAGIVKGMSEGLKYGVEHEGAKLDLAALEAYDPEAEGKYIAALTALKDMKYPLVDQLEQLKDAPIDLLMTSLHLESDTGEDAPPFIRDLRPSSSQLKIPVSDGVPVSVPAVIPQGLQIQLEDAATQTELSEDEASPKLIRSKSLPSMYNLNWP
ncbi:hypothetical protein Tco_0228587 [Tanacetum coccineum]